MNSFAEMAFESRELLRSAGRLCEACLLCQFHPVSKNIQSENRVEITREMSYWSTSPTTVPAGSDRYFHIDCPYVRSKTWKSSDNPCRSGLWAGRVDHWWLLSCSNLPSLSLSLLYSKKQHFHGFCLRFFFFSGFPLYFSLFSNNHGWGLEKCEFYFLAFTVTLWDAFMLFQCALIYAFFTGVGRSISTKI